MCMQSHVDLTEDSVSGNITAPLGELALLQIQGTRLDKVSALWFQKCCTCWCLPGYRRHFTQGGMGAECRLKESP